MALFTGQVAVSTAGTVLCIVPPGPGEVIISNAGTGVIYLGVGGTAITAANGMPVPSGGIAPFALYQGSGGGTLRAIASAGTSTAGFLVSTAYGLTQPGQQ